MANGTNAGVGYSNGNWTNRGNVNVNIGWRSALPPYARYRSAHGTPWQCRGIKDLVPALYNERKRKTAVMGTKGSPLCVGYVLRKRSRWPIRK